MSYSDMDKLRILLPHWIEHNHDHESDFVQWAEKSRKAGQHLTAELIEQAIAGLIAADLALTKALETLGGPPSGHDHHHDHQH